MKFILLVALLGYACGEKALEQFSTSAPDFVLVPFSSDLKCQPGKVVNPCGDLCQVTCKDVTTNNVPKACIEICNPPACVCPDGQALIRGQCVSYGHCWRLPHEEDPASEKLECPAGKVLDPCGDLCEVTCHDVTTNNIPKPCPKICHESTCVCPNGTALHHLSHTCVPYGSCWRLPADTPHSDHSSSSGNPEESNRPKNPQQKNLKVCGPNEVFSPCGRRCEKTCATWHVLNPFCASGPCLTGGNCTCKDDYVRNEQGVCVPPTQCPNFESAHQTQLESKQNIKKFSDSQRGGSSSSESSEESHAPNTLKQMPLKICGSNEEYSSCGRRCEKSCLTLYVLNPFCSKGPCIEDCTCKDGYVRNEQGVCLPPTECPNFESAHQTQLKSKQKIKKTSGGQRGGSSSSESSEESDAPNTLKQMPSKTCGPNEEYSSCGRRCEQSCLTMYVFNPFCSKGPCIEDCTCKDGYVRNEQYTCVPYAQCPNFQSG